MSTAGKGKADYLQLGDSNAVCYECGRKFKASQLKRHWKGYWVCPAHFEVRHPQDFVRAIADTQLPAFVQPMPTDVFVAVTYTKALNDTVEFVETMAKAVSIVVRNDLTYSTSFIDESLGTLSIGTGILAGGGGSLGYAHTITLTDSATFAIGRASSASDSVSITETVTVNLVITNAIGFQPLASTTLG